MLGTENPTVSKLSLALKQLCPTSPWGDRRHSYKRVSERYMRLVPWNLWGSAALQRGLGKRPYVRGRLPTPPQYLQPHAFRVDPAALKNV